MELWVEAWHLSTPDKRELFWTVSNALSKDGQDSIALNFLVKYLNTFVGEAYPDDVRGIIITAVVSAVKSPVSSFPDRATLFEVG